MEGHAGNAAAARAAGGVEALELAIRELWLDCKDMIGTDGTDKASRRAFGTLEVLDPGHYLLRQLRRFLT